MLPLLNQAKEEYHRLQIDRALLYVVDDSLAVRRQLALESRGVCPQLLGRIVKLHVLLPGVVEQGVGPVEEPEYLLAECHEGRYVFAVHRQEVVAYMLAAGLCDTLEAIEHLVERSYGEEVPGVALYAQHVIDPAEGKYLLAALALELVALLLDA